MDADHLRAEARAESIGAGEQFGAVPAGLHARAARRAGASLGELTGVAELALITAGMPAYSLGVEILAEMAEEEARAEGSHPAARP